MSAGAASPKGDATPGATPRDWDAATYDRVSDPQVAMAGPVLDRLPLRGDETVLDASVEISWERSWAPDQLGSAPPAVPGAAGGAGR